ncbi:unnamed protein product [Clonostachys rhizophaga]|uniref:Uncharacterized protein n=1 Tax=Clonostachys rhizophaga TaxID=160324 RepID=A0A9N9W2T9_9HYPO|nr:unnamed protein product [Clonostachys rhizophaga]
MYFASALATLLAAASVSASGPIYGMDGIAKYPICPDGYETYCCMTVTPYSHSCSRGRCSNTPGWSCVIGPGKVESMKYCMNELGGNKDPYCKKPGYENFGSVLRWTGGSFKPMLEPSNYRQYLRPGMHPPWVPSDDEIKWETETEESGDGFETELRKREPDHDETDMA